MRAEWPSPRPPAAGWYHDGDTLRWWDGDRWGPAAPQADGGWRQVDPIESGTALAVLSHVGFFLLAVILPLVFRQTEGKTNRYVRHHATEALNFQLTFMAVWIGGIITMVSFTSVTTDDGEVSGWWALPFIGMIVLYAAGAVLAVLGAVRAGQKRWWTYPLRIPFVRGPTPER